MHVLKSCIFVGTLLFLGCADTSPKPANASACSDELGKPLTLCGLQQDIKMLYNRNVSNQEEIETLQNTILRQGKLIDELAAVANIQRRIINSLKASLPANVDSTEEKSAEIKMFSPATFVFLKDYEAKLGKESKKFLKDEPITSHSGSDFEIVVSGYFVGRKWTESPQYKIPKDIVKKK